MTRFDAINYQIKIHQTQTSSNPKDRYTQ